MTKTERKIRNSDPRFIVWRDLCISGELTESIIREYKDFIWDRMAWLDFGIVLGLSDDFVREFSDKYDIELHGD